MKIYWERSSARESNRALNCVEAEDRCVVGSKDIKSEIPTVPTILKPCV